MEPSEHIKRPEKIQFPLFGGHRVDAIVHEYLTHDARLVGFAFLILDDVITHPPTNLAGRQSAVHIHIATQP
jgi:hypothetical protein